jgi:hypothetical protein
MRSGHRAAPDAYQEYQGLLGQVRTVGTGS